MAAHRVFSVTGSKDEDKDCDLPIPTNLRSGMDQEMEPVEVVKEVIELLSTFQDSIQERRCCGDEPWLFRERWEKLFDIKHKRFDLSHVLELYGLVLHCQRARPVGAGAT